MVLLCLLVGVVGAIDRRFEAMAGRIVALEVELGAGRLALESGDALVVDQV